MYDSQREAPGDTPVSPAVVDWPRIREACQAKYGSSTNTECAQAMGVTKRSLDRFRRNPASSMRTALRISEATGLRLDEFIRRPAAAFEQAA